MSLPFTIKTGSEIRHNARLKKYADGSYQLMVCTHPVFAENGWEELDYYPKTTIPMPAKDRKSAPDPAPENILRATRRAASQCRDLALSNSFSYFVTLTLAPDRIDRYDPAAIVKKLNVWLDHHVRRDGLAYVLVPERHKDGAVHFHGFFNDALPVLDSGTLSVPESKKPRKPRSAADRQRMLADGGRIVYNIPAWDLGFSTALELYGDYHSAVGYVLKYVRKQPEKIGGRWYYHGGKLKKPEVSYPDVDYREIEATGKGYAFSVAGKRFQIVTGKTEDHL